jgi:hypothetical protein
VVAGGSVPWKLEGRGLRGLKKEVSEQQES